MVGSKGWIETCNGIIMVDLNDWFCISKFLIQIFFWPLGLINCSGWERLLFCGYIRKKRKQKVGVLVCVVVFVLLVVTCACKAWHDTEATMTPDDNPWNPKAQRHSAISESHDYGKLEKYKEPPVPYFSSLIFWEPWERMVRTTLLITH